MNDPQTALELQHLVEKLTPEEQVRLARLALRLARSTQAYAESPPTEAEFTSDNDSLGWDAEGWDEFSAKG